jgi:hypothetical protein
MMGTSYVISKHSSGTHGGIGIFSLKNIEYPEFYLSFDSGVVSLQWNQRHYSYICLCLASGIIMSFDVRICVRCVVINYVDYLK